MQFVNLCNHSLGGQTETYACIAICLNWVVSSLKNFVPDISLKLFDVGFILYSGTQCVRLHEGDMVIANFQWAWKNCFSTFRNNFSPTE